VIAASLAPQSRAGCFDHCVQHRLHTGGRAADDIEHVAGRGLIFERLWRVRACNSPSSRAFSIAMTALIGEGAHQLDLPLVVTDAESAPQSRAAVSDYCVQHRLHIGKSGG